MIGPGRHLASLRHWMAPGARSKFGAPMFDFEVFRQQMYCIEDVILTLLELFDAPHSYSAPPVVIRRPGNCSLFSPRYAPPFKQVHLVMGLDNALRQISIRWAHQKDSTWEEYR